MFCGQCGAAIQAGQMFCSGCGRQIGMAPAIGPQNRVAENIKLVAILWMALSALRLIPGLVLMMASSVAAAFLPPDVPGFVSVLLHGIGFLLLAIGAVGFLVGWGLMDRQPWARMAAVVLGFLSLLEFPFGTALGIYTLWVLMPAQSEMEYRQMAVTG